VNEYLLEDKPARTFERIAALAECDLLVFGHTHKPWIHEHGCVRFVNCGSVGKPKDGDARARRSPSSRRQATVFQRRFIELATTHLPLPGDEDRGPARRARRETRGSGVTVTTARDD
jgi:hypothetical protein